MSGASDDPFAALGPLGDRYGLGASALARLESLLTLLRADPAPPTTVTAPAEAIDVHVADSLVALEVEAVRHAGVLADIGSGAGFPGLPLAIALPEATVHLLESARRRCAFLARAAETTATPNASVVCARVEEWSAGHARCDVICARALAPLAVLAEYAAPLLRRGGSLIAWKGARNAVEEADGAAAATAVGLSRAEVMPVSPYAGSRVRHLHHLVKHAATPARYPRRPGMARKRPLGARSGDLRR